MQALGTPTATELKAMLRMNLIKDCEVKTEDVNLAEKVYGPDVGAIKGKSTRVKPTPVTSEIIEIPDELLKLQEEITLSMDGLQVNTVKFLTTISHNIYYRTAQALSANPKHKDYIYKLHKIELLYRKAGFRFSKIHADLEFKKL